MTVGDQVNVPEIAGYTYVGHIYVAETSKLPTTGGETDKGSQGDKGDKGDQGDKGNPGDNGTPGVTNNFSITYYINGQKVTNLDPDGYIADVKTTYLPTPAFSASEVFSGWYDNAALTGNPMTQIEKSEKGNKTFYGTIRTKTYTISFNSKGGSSITPEVVDHGAMVTTPVAPTKDDEEPGYSYKGLAPAHDFNFGGWYSDEALTQVFDFSTPITADTTLYAKWNLPITEAGENNNLTALADSTLGNDGDMVWFNNEWWRILREDMDADASNGLQALVIQENPIGKVQFHSTMMRYFINGTSSTGYGDSLLKETIDTWYQNHIAIAPELEAYVQPVSLNLPTFPQFSDSGKALTSGSTFTNWRKSNYHEDTRFPTELASSGRKQGFALSYGDIGTLNYTTGTSNSLLNFTGYTILRSPGHSYDSVGYIYESDFKNPGTLNHPLPVRISLSLQSK